MVTEASLLATNAIHALKDILSGKLERGKNTEYLETAARENWGVTFQKGIFRRPKNLVVSSGEDRLKRALGAIGRLFLVDVRMMLTYGI